MNHGSTILVGATPRALPRAGLAPLAPYVLGTALAWFSIGRLDWVMAIAGALALVFLAWTGARAGIGAMIEAPPARALAGGLVQALVMLAAYVIQAGFGMLPLLAALPWVLAQPAVGLVRELQGARAGPGTQRRRAIAYAVLVLAAALAFVPLWPRLQPAAYLFVAVPIVLLCASAALTFDGGWRIRSRMEQAAILGASGALSIPLALTLAFLVTALLER